jgi:tRNA A-37 threonylcarbamoyl transferase component Bud32
MQGPQMSPDVFAKDGFPEEIRLELEKLRLAHAIGESSNLFCVPEILDVDVPAGRLHLEHLTGLRTLAELAASDDPGLMPALRLLGRSLSAVHEQLRLSEEDTIPLPDEWMGLDDENAYLHGDLTVCNVGWDDSTGRLVMFDWALSRIIGVPATYGSRYFDLAWFVRSVFWSVPWRRRPLYPAGRMCDEFLASYAASWDGFSTERFLSASSGDRIRAFRQEGTVSERILDVVRRARWRAFRAALTRRGVAAPR